MYVPSEDSELAVHLLRVYLGKTGKTGLSILDMGTGTGILGMCAAMDRNADNVLFADIDDAALALARSNVMSNRNVLRAKCAFIKTDMFSKIPSKKLFDLIMFNPPYLPSEGERSALQNTWDGGPTGIEVSAEFMRQSVLHLNKDGALLLVASSFSDTDRLFRIAEACGFMPFLKQSVHIFFEDITAALFKKL